MDLIVESNYYFDCVNKHKELSNLNKQMKKDRDRITQGSVPTVLKYDYYVICLKERFTDKICSFIYFSFRDDFEDLDKIIYINYSYTFINYRKQGLNKMLRLILENSCRLNNCKAIISVPFIDSESRIVMDKLGYQNIKSDIYIKYV